MATFTYTVDAQLLARELDTLSAHVDKTTDAVVTLQEAVIAAEKQAADHICDKLNKGFFTLIRSQISQKIARLQSEADSLLMQLNRQKKTLVDAQSRMEGDYGRISSRYLKLFDGLNVNLRQRIFELDKPILDCAVKEAERLANRTRYLTATVPVAQLESLSAGQQISAARVKYCGLHVIHSMKKFLCRMSDQQKVINRILLPNGGAIDAALWIPVIISETNHDKSGHTSVDIAVSAPVPAKTTQSAIKSAIMQDIDRLAWRPEEINREVRSEFNKILSDSTAPQRVKDVIHNLFRSTPYQTLRP
jgi:cell division septum initiation protein DivIVA